MALYIGLMSGTSLDGVDAVLTDVDGHGRCRSVAHHHQAYDPALRQLLWQLNSPGDGELHHAALAANGVARAYADSVARLLQQAGQAASAITALGAHGQTVRHRPGEFDGTGYTSQLLAGALLAECCGIDVVCDFRSRDVAAGGQGAPLVPAFHAGCFGQAGVDVAVLNLGGIANLSLLKADGDVTGFDTGPANALMDHWCQQHTGQAFDAGGRWAAGGQVQPALLALCLADPFFERAPPKSTGRDLFNPAWLQERLVTWRAAAGPLAAQATPQDVMATLNALTVASAAGALQRHLPGAQRLLVCGGGAFNAQVMTGLAAALPGVQVASTASVGVAPDQVEALAFAWLAWAFQQRVAGNRVAVTGARGERVLGALYPR